MRSKLFQRLDALAIPTRTVEHPPVHSVADSAELYEKIPGGHTKNLFLKDAKGRLFLVVAHHDTTIDLKRLPQLIGSARLSFASADLLHEVLGVTPGSVTAFALMNDAPPVVTLIFDAHLMGFDVVNLHPMENVATTSIAREDLLRFIRATGHEPLVVALPGLHPGSRADAHRTG